MTLTTRSRSTRALLACGLAAPLFVAAIFVEGALRPGYRSVDHFISELSLGRWGWIQITNFIATGLLLIAFAVGLRSALSTGRGSRSAPILAAACGLALITAGIFSMDPTPGYHPDGSVPDKPTLHGTIHGFMPFALYVALAALACVLGRRFAAQGGRRAWMWYCYISAVATPATFMLAATQYNFQTQTGHNHGLWNRVSLVIGLGWLGLVTLRLILDAADTRRASGAPTAPDRPLAARP
ncbi:DUF998 domain-containing protein [Dactylosporangium sp. CA-139066]|uniref:DUF998 domain-containing protein n=1 Tax=Dactylosporangium sp. CA-139066 TaxID=3239930 RepID=UPI003D8FE4FE